MANIIPCLTSIECRWKPRIVQRPDVVEVSGQMRDVMRNVELAQELKIQFDWFEGNNNLFYQVFTWGAEKIPAMAPLLERPAASTLIGDKSLFALVAKDLFQLCKDEVAPAVQSVPYGIRTYVPADNAVSNLRVYLPYDKPRERIVDLEVIHYLDEACTQTAFIKGKQWLSRDLIAERKLSDEVACEELLNNDLIEPNVVKCIRKCAELVKGIYPTFAIDIDAWMQLTEATIDSYNPAVLAG